MFVWKYPFTVFSFLKFEFASLLLQIWKMPKLWVGFLKLAYQTQPRSLDVLLQVLVLVYYVTEYILDIHLGIFTDMP